MELLQTQVQAIFATIDGRSGFSRNEFRITHEGGNAIVSYNSDRRHRFTISGSPPSSHYMITLAPAKESADERRQAAHWAQVLLHLANWLDYLRRELSVVEEVGVPTPPSWVETALPSEAIELQEQIGILEKQLSEISKMSELLWQTGTPLNGVVNELFRRLDYGSILVG